jgi:hypothetical protein
MRARLLLASLLVSGLALRFGAARLSSQDPAHEEAETTIQKHMHLVEDAQKKLRRLVRDPARIAEAIEEIERMELATFACKSEVPLRTADLADAEREAFVRDYRKGIAQLLAAELELEIALLEADSAKAQAIFERFSGMEDTGHERFTNEE